MLYQLSYRPIMLLKKMAVRTGLEPATSCVTGRHSNQLNYRTIWLRGQDLNLRPSGYEPDELPGCSTPRMFLGKRTVCDDRQDGITRASGTGSAAPDAARCGTPTPRDTRTPPDRLSIAATGAQVASWRDALP